MFGGAEESTRGNFLGRGGGGGGGGGANFQMVEKNLCMGGKALPLLPHSQYICWKYIIEDRENPQPYSIF